MIKNASQCKYHYDKSWRRSKINLCFLVISVFL